MHDICQRGESSFQSERQPSDLDKQFTAGRLALLLGFLFLIAYPDIVLGSHAFFYRDAGLFGYPLAYYSRDCFWRGEIPLWNPYNDCGIPFLAQWNTLVLYPPSLFYLLLPMPWSLNYFILGHVIFAGIGMYFLANTWFRDRFAASVAGLAFAWNGFTLHALMWPNNAAALAWMPWIILLMERVWNQEKKALVWASLAGAMQMMAGAPEVILFTWSLAGIFLIPKMVAGRFCCWRICLRLLLVVILVIGLSAAQLLPFLDLLAHGNRSTSFGGDAWAMPAWGWANFLVPLFRCTPSVTGVFSQNEQQWTSSYYPGIAIVALALVAALRIHTTRTRLLGLTTFLGILFALGNNGFVLPAVKHLVPGLGSIRYPIKFVLITLFCLPLLAAATIAWSQKETTVSVRRALLASAAVVCANVFLICLVAYYFPFVGDSWKITWKNGAVRLLLFTIVLAAILHLQQVERRRTRLSLSFGILLLLGLDVLSHAPRQNPTIITRGYESWSPHMNEKPRLGQSRAMISPDIQARMERSAHPYPLNYYLGQRSVLLDDCNLLGKITKIDGFFSIYLREEYEVESLLYHSKQATNLAEFLGVSQVTSSTQLFAWDERTNFMPLATIGQQPVFADATTTLNALASAEFNPRQIVYLPRESEHHVSATQATDARIVSRQFAAHEMNFETASSLPAMLVLAQAYYHPWKPYVDGKPTSLLRANHAFQAIEVPAGQHKIRLVYEDWNFYFGAMISTVTLAGCVAFLLLQRKQIITTKIS